VVGVIDFLFDWLAIQTSQPLPTSQPHPTQATNSWLLVFTITAAHYVVGALVWAAWAGGDQLAEDFIDDEPGTPGEGGPGWEHIAP